MKTITINWEVPASKGTMNCTLEDLNHTNESWEELSDEDKEQELNEYLLNTPEAINIMVDTFEEN